MPHSYDAPLFRFIDDFYPWAQTELMQRHFDNLLTNTIKALWEDPARTFTHYETRYFADWYLR